MTQKTIDQLQENAKADAVNAFNGFVNEFGRTPTEGEAKLLFRSSLEDLALANVLASQ